MNFFLGIYSAFSDKRSLNNYQYLHFIKLITKNKGLNLKSLSSTSSTQKNIFKGLLPLSDMTWF